MNHTFNYYEKFIDKFSNSGVGSNLDSYYHKQERETTKNM